MKQIPSLGDAKHISLLEIEYTLLHLSYTSVHFLALPYMDFFRLIRLINPFVQRWILAVTECYSNLSIQCL